MGGYRSLKRVLGESNLERKCRWLFGLCVGGLIVVAFFSVDWIAENLISNNAKDNGRGVARQALNKLHWELFDTNPDSKILQKEITRQMYQEFLDARWVKLDAAPELSRATTPVFPPENDRERNLLRKLKLEAEERFAKSGPDIPPASGDAGKDAEAATQQQDSLPTVADAYVDPHDNKYYYYEVVQWASICKGCHLTMYAAQSQSASATYSGSSVFDPSSTPFRVIRVTMPYAETRTAIDRTRAILLAVGILTVFLAMVALYYVVKYIVIKPLNHLRDVSDEVARGDLAQRADIHTNDEFEDLAESFNKMLRHLIDAHAELREANEELDGKVDELAHLNMQLHEMNRLKGEFLANMSHELRTPLNSIIGFSEVLQSLDALNEKQKRYAQNIQKSGRLLLDMINDILDLAKMEAGKMEVRLSEFRIDAVIYAQCDMVRALAEEKNIDLTVEIENDLPLLYQDQAKVQQILTNLLSNAIKFTPEGGRITVGARGDARGRIEFWVADTGVGIPASEKDIIFEKFRQGKAVLGRDNLTREYSGTGLGLSIVKELCKLLGGEVAVESELGKGSTFRVVIPWMRTDTPAAAAKLTAKLDELARPRRPETAEVAATTGGTMP
jgi:two-component system, NarL family, sensor histidine kinase BarA